MYFNLTFLANIKKNIIYSLPNKGLGLSLMSKKLVDRFHYSQAKILAYLPETPEQIQQCYAADVDYILTNHMPLNDLPG